MTPNLPMASGSPRKSSFLTETQRKATTGPQETASASGEKLGESKAESKAATVADASDEEYEGNDGDDDEDDDDKDDEEEDGSSSSEAELSVRKRILVRLPKAKHCLDSYG